MNKYDRMPDLDAIDKINGEIPPEMIFDIWMYIIKHLDKFDTIPEPLRNGIFERFFREAEIQAYSPEERMAYEQSLKAYRDYNNTISSAEYVGELRGVEKGRAQGRKEGMVAGRLEEKKSLASKMKEGGIPTQQIAAITGLPLDEIASL